MPYNPSNDLVGLWRAVSGGVEKAEMPGLDFVVSALTRAGLMRTVTSQTAPTANQSTTAWFKPATQSFASEGSLFMWDPTLSMYVPATPELFHGGSSGGGGDGGGGGTGMVIISGTQPSNPATGAEWWDGSVMRVFDGGAWKIVGPGGAAGPVPTTTRAFGLNQSTQMTVTANTWSILPLSATPSIDAFVGWNGTTHIYKPTRAGFYQFFVRAITYGAGYSSINLLKNDQGAPYAPATTEQVCETQINLTTAAYVVISAAGISQMNGTTDFVRLWGSSSDGTFYVQNAPDLEAYLLP